MFFLLTQVNDSGFFLPEFCFIKIKNMETRINQKPWGIKSVSFWIVLMVALGWCKSPITQPDPETIGSRELAPSNELYYTTVARFFSFPILPRWVFEKLSVYLSP